MLTLHIASPRRPSATGLFTADEYARRRAFFSTRTSATPLVHLPALAARLGVAGLAVKDETTRFGLPAFKSLGVEFAVDALAARGELDGVTTLVCASAGNHGRAVARAARHTGRRARIFLDRDVSPERRAAIASEGAEVVTVDGTYDDAVRVAARDAEASGGLVISDTSWDGYTRVPHDIMLGYTEIMDDAESAWAGSPPPDVVVVPAGVGGLLAAVASWLAWRYGEARPRLVAVEPTRAASVQAAVRAGHPVVLEGPLTTIMAGLRCGEVSPLAFSVIPALVDAYVAVDDTWCREAMRTLACPSGLDPAIAVGTAGAAGVAALLAIHAASDATVGGRLGIGRDSHVMTIATEGVTEPGLWSEVTGRAAPG